MRDRNLCLMPGSLSFSVKVTIFYDMCITKIRNWFSINTGVVVLVNYSVNESVIWLLVIHNKYILVCVSSS